MRKTAYSIFLSYAHDDKQVARALGIALRKEGLKVWIDEGQLRTGDSIIATIASAISEVEFVIALVSTSSVKSHWCKKELALAVNDGLKQGRVRVLPLRLDAVQMPDSLADVMYLQVTSRRPFSKKLITRLISDVRAHRRDLQDRSKQEHRLRPLSPFSTIDRGTLKKFRAMLADQRYLERNDWDWEDELDEARDALINDYSVPAVEALFLSASRDLHLGWACRGLIELAPVTSPWIRRLLEHKNPTIVSGVMEQLNAESGLITRRDLLDTFRTIQGMGNWPKLEKHIRSALKRTHSSLLLEAEAIFQRLKPIRPRRLRS